MDKLSEDILILLMMMMMMKMKMKNDDDHLCCQAAPSRVADWDIGDSRPLLTASGSKRVWRGGCGWSTSWYVVAVEVLAQMQSLPRRR
jgi:hypothetical protein